MDFKLGKINLHAVAQGVGGLVFGGDNQSSASEDSFVERYLDRISNGVRAEDRRAAMLELQSLVAESRSAQLAFGAMGFPVLMGVLKEERDDVEMVRGALETLISALTPIDPSHGLKSDVQPDLMNSDLLSREPENISLLLSLLLEEDFYVRYYTLQLLTALLTKSPNWLQEAILAIPRGITRLVDMLLDREVIRNEALLLLTYLTREAEEIQKILVFEGVFEKIFSIIKEEGGSEGGVVVQDCLVLLNNVIRNNASNQILLRETVGLEPLVSNFKLRKGSTYRFSQQKTVNLLNALETIGLLLVGGGEAEPGKDANRVANQTVLAQKNILDHLLMLGVESKWAPVAVRCSALHCIGDLIVKNPHNLDLLARMVGEDSHAEPALNSILRILLWTSSVYEFIAADYVLKCFCEKNTEGQVMLASTMIEPQSSSNETPEEDVHMSFGSILLSGIVSSGTDGDLQTCSRAASVLSHILKDNVQSKERVLRNEIEAPLASLVEPEPLMHRFVKYLARAASMKTKEPDHGNSLVDGDSFIQPVILRLLITWLADCPDAVNLFLALPTHLTFLIELVSNQAQSIYVRSLGAVLLGLCVLYNKNPGDDGRDSFAVVDTICQTIGLTAYFLIFEEMQKSVLFVSATSTQYRKPLTRSNTASMTDLEDEDAEIVGIDDRQHEHPFFLAIFDRQFVNFIKGLEAQIREGIVDVFSHPKRKVAVVPAELEQKDGESSEEYIKRLKSFVEKQCNEMQDLLGRNGILAEDLAKNGENSGSFSDQKVADGRDRVQSDTLRRQLHEAKQSIETLKSEKAKIEAEASMCRNMARKIESDLKSLSDAYNSLEKDNFRLDSEVKALRRGEREPVVDLEAIRVEAREEAQKESEVELNDLLVCLGQEQTKVEKLSTRLIELGEDVDSLLEGIGDDAGLPESGEDED